jgi:hypothetical protein
MTIVHIGAELRVTIEFQDTVVRCNGEWMLRCYPYGKTLWLYHYDDAQQWYTVSDEPPGRGADAVIGAIPPDVIVEMRAAWLAQEDTP